MRLSVLCVHSDDKSSLVTYPGLLVEFISYSPHSKQDDVMLCVSVCHSDPSNRLQVSTSDGRVQGSKRKDSSEERRDGASKRSRSGRSPSVGTKASASSTATRETTTRGERRQETGRIER